VIAGQEQRSFTTFVRAGDVETSVANAVVKLARHIDEFEALGFGLSGSEPGPAGGDREIRAREKKRYFDLDIDYANHEKWFLDESDADQTAGEVLTGHFERLAQSDIYDAEWQRYLAVHALCAAALCAWYRDLLAFCRNVGLYPVANVRSLTAAMMQGPEAYIRAAALFGEVHRSTLLRSGIAIQKLLSADFLASDGSGRIEGNHTSTDRERMCALWRRQSWRCYYLVAMLLDTAVKIAYVGSSAGWLLEKMGGARRPFVMMFEPIDAAMKRVDRLLEKFARRN
jgi:hypothetical protein